MRLVLAPDHEAPGAARSFVSGQLADTALPPGVVLADVILTASELVTNAVRAGAGHLELMLAVNHRQLDLMVEDDAQGWPVLQSANADAAGGRGLGIVEQVSDKWHVTRTKSGKRVTATWLAPGALAPQ